jgi:hypothetical protein
MKNIILFLLISTVTITAQQVYEIPFASKGNEIELTFENINSFELSGIKVTSEAPGWIKLTGSGESITGLPGKSLDVINYRFDIDKSAPVNETSAIKFKIESSYGSWQKEINVTVLAPEEFKLEQNYPNPFNPSTIIEYELPAEVKVDLRIYNILGEHVEQLVNEIQKPGLQQVEWNANNYASGIYIYQVYIEGKDIDNKVQRKKMMLIK